MDERREEQRREADREAAVWRGGIDARIHTLEAQVAATITDATSNAIALARMEEQIKGIRAEIVDLHDDLAETLKKVDKGREESVQELKDTIASKTIGAREWIIAVFMVSLPVMSTILVAVFSK